MGKVKLPLTGTYAIHGTPDERSLGKPASHGCVRLANTDAIDLATLLQESMLSAAKRDSITAIALPTLRHTVVKLPRRIPVEIRYDLIELHGDTLFVHPDPYGLGGSPAVDAAVARARAWRDTTAIDYARLRRMTRYPTKTSVTLPVRHRSQE